MMKQKKQMKQNVIVTALLFAVFILYTVAVQTVDVRPVGPEQSEVGFATVNEFIFNLLGEHLLWYQITEWCGIAAMAAAFGFAVLGLVQLLRRKSIRRVDQSIIALGGMYLAAVAAYVFFEIYIVNYRPVIMGEGLEASFPSSHTMIVLCIMGTAMMQFHSRIANRAVRLAVNTGAAVIILITVAGRLVSGVHWFSDIVGGVILGLAMIMLYDSMVRYMACKTKAGDGHNSTKR